ncbi:hypothetical protein COO60DRAFT_1102785 [Scenedesmus sp. NREL 46B-D3]|nr:hypothetical protein COO60DRAFT_1102785 [Scenedesmus sp. NREL 46B-D3]
MPWLPLTQQSKAVILAALYVCVAGMFSLFHEGKGSLLQLPALATTCCADLWERGTEHSPERHQQQLPLQLLACRQHRNQQHGCQPHHQPRRTPLTHHARRHLLVAPLAGPAPVLQESAAAAPHHVGCSCCSPACCLQLQARWPAHHLHNTSKRVRHGHLRLTQTQFSSVTHQRHDGHHCQQQARRPWAHLPPSLPQEGTYRVHGVYKTFSCCHGRCLGI